MNTHPADAFAAIPDPALRDMLADFPFPLAVVGIDSGEIMPNSRFAALIDPALIREPPLRDLVMAPAAMWQRLTLPGRAGLPVDVAARALHTGYGSVVMLDPTTARADRDEIETLHLRIAELEERSATDRLTGTWNRHHFDSIIRQEIARSARSRQPLSLILFDLDHFKQVNDRHGHAAGDDVLQAFARLLQAEARASDLVFRWGGEEFVVLAAGSGRRAAGHLAERIRRAVESFTFPHAGRITVSVGVAEHVASAPLREWFERADSRLYDAKARGRNCVSVDALGADEAEDGGTAATLQLSWREEFECGEPLIDEQHRRLFADANRLIHAVLGRRVDRERAARAMETLVGGIVEHFRTEEAILELRGYPQVRGHARAHASLLRRASMLKKGVDEGSTTLGEIVQFLAVEVVAEHLFTADREFFPLFQPEAVDVEPAGRVRIAARD
jgi:diguanylate cyclase (GGDEF)-like protein/hemerythrin-like metal-binding protein